MAEKATYLGDGAYVVYDGYSFSVRANSHLVEECTDQVFIEPEGIESLYKFYKEVMKDEKNSKS